MEPAQPAGQASAANRTRWLGLAGLCIGVFMFTLDASIVNVASPTLVHALHTTFAMVQWVVLAYLLVATALVMAAARWGDMFGKRRLYMAGLALFTCGSLFCGLAPTIGWLLACRALQGLGAVFVSALGAAIVGEMFPPQERGRAMGMIGSAVLFGVAMGPSIGGFIIELAGWRWMFLVNLPVGVLALWVVYRFVPAIPGRPARHPFDWPGTLLAAVMLGAFALALTWGQRDGFGDPVVIALSIAALIGLIAFLRVESSRPGPLLDLSVFNNRSFANGLFMAVLMFMVLSGTGFLMPFFLEVVAGYPTARVGMLLAISPIAGGIVAPIGGALADRIGARFVTIAGLSLIALGCATFVTVDQHLGALGYALRVVPIGFGMGLFNAANNSSVLNAVPRERLGLASALLSLMRTLGQTTGVPLIATIFSLAALGHAVAGNPRALLNSPPEALLRGMHFAFGAAACLVVCGIASAAFEYVHRRASEHEGTIDPRAPKAR
jgi:EmrB/QacA subfamily drug resistance transporter